MREQEILGQREVNSSRAMLFCWKLYLLPKMDSCAVKFNNTSRFSLIAKAGIIQHQQPEQKPLQEQNGKARCLQPGFNSC